MNENFIRHRLEVLILFLGVIFCVTQPWIERKTAFKAKPHGFTDFLVWAYSTAPCKGLALEYCRMCSLLFARSLYRGAVGWSSSRKCDSQVFSRGKPMMRMMMQVIIICGCHQFFPLFIIQCSRYRLHATEESVCTVRVRFLEEQKGSQSLKTNATVSSLNWKAIRPLCVPHLLAAFCTCVRALSSMCSHVHLEVVLL